MAFGAPKVHLGVHPRRLAADLHRPLEAVAANEVRSFGEKKGVGRRNVQVLAFEAKNWKLESEFPHASRRLIKSIKDTRIKDKFVWDSDLPIGAAKMSKEARNIRD